MPKYVLYNKDTEDIAYYGGKQKKLTPKKQKLLFEGYEWKMVVGRPPSSDLKFMKVADNKLVFKGRDEIDRIKAEREEEAKAMRREELLALKEEMEAL